MVCGRLHLTPRWIARGEHIEESAVSHDVDPCGGVLHCSSDAGDAVGAWFGDKLAAVVFPTSSTRKQLQQLAERSPNPPDLMLIANPQWELEVRLSTGHQCT
jgi:hypothetical protein